MVLSLLKNIMPKASVKKSQPAVEIPPAKKEESVKKESYIGRSPYKGAFYGAMFGIGAGIGDGFVTATSMKKEAKKGLKEFNGYCFADKKKAIQALHNSGKDIKEYKQTILKVLNTPTYVTMLKRGLFYGSLVAATGAAIDIYCNYKAKTENKEQNPVK